MFLLLEEGEIRESLGNSDQSCYPACPMIVVKDAIRTNNNVRRIEISFSIKFLLLVRVSDLINLGNKGSVQENKYIIRGYLN